MNQPMAIHVIAVIINRSISFEILRAPFRKVKGLIYILIKTELMTLPKHFMAISGFCKIVTVACFSLMACTKSELPEQKVQSSIEDPVTTVPERDQEKKDGESARQDINPNQDAGPQARQMHVVAFDFTGQRCSYCPNMTRELEKRKIEYGSDSFFLIALHSDYSYSPFLYSSEAQKYEENLIAAGSMHHGFPNNIYNSLGNFKLSLKLDELRVTPSMFKITSSGKRIGNHVSVQFKAEVCEGQQNRIQNRSFIILVWLTENNLISYQSDMAFPSGMNVKHVHHSVFRKSLNGLWGNAYKPGTLFTSESEITSDGLAMPITLAHAQIICILLDSSTKEVVAASEIEL